MMYWYKYDLLFDEIFFYRFKKEYHPQPGRRRLERFWNTCEGSCSLTDKQKSGLTTNLTGQGDITLPRKND